MAKIAQCGFGSQGQGRGPNEEGYTYVVNDNVRTGDVIQVISTSRKNRKFATTAVPFHAYKETSVKGQEAKQEAVTAMEDKGRAGELTRSYSGKELGVKGSKAKPIISVDPDGTEHKAISKYEQATRAGNIAMYKQQNPNAEWTEKSQETFDSYSKQFMKGE